ncbi:MAG: 6-bladed beta-propeller [Tissierellia bacterium]|nr:6-bladed beta-propeller [Tissierellia bacterium]
MVGNLVFRQFQIYNLGTRLRLSPYLFCTLFFSRSVLKRNNLPNPPESYIHFKNFNDSTYLIWGNSFQNPSMGNIILLSKKTNEVINSFWKGEGIEDRFVVSPFWTYNERIYFSTSITNNVYQITPEGYKLIYKWDFGKYDIDKFRKKEIATTIDLKNSSDRIQQIVQKMMYSDKLYRFNSRFENDLYYYAQIVFKNDKNLAPHIFYNKKTGMSNYFFKTIEGLSFITYSFTKDYIIGELLTDGKKEILSSNILNEEDETKLNLIKEDDNPVILKIYFKHENN